MSRITIIITSTIIIGVGVVSFFIGRSVGKKSTSSSDSNQ